MHTMSEQATDRDKWLLVVQCIVNLRALSQRSCRQWLWLPRTENATCHLRQKSVDDP